MSEPPDPPPPHAPPVSPRSVAVFDGTCVFCSRQAARLRRLDRSDAFEIAAAEDPGLLERFPALSASEGATGMRLVTPDGHVHVGADAVHEIARRLPRWRRVAWIYRVPGLHQMCRAAYFLIARNRYRLGGRRADGVCALDPDAGAGDA